MQITMTKLATQPSWENKTFSTKDPRFWDDATLFSSPSPDGGANIADDGKYLKKMIHQGHMSTDRSGSRLTKRLGK
jgi:hypothetical protein